MNYIVSYEKEMQKTRNKLPVVKEKGVEKEEIKVKDKEKDINLWFKRKRPIMLGF